MCVCVCVCVSVCVLNSCREFRYHVVKISVVSEFWIVSSKNWNVKGYQPYLKKKKKSKCIPHLSLVMKVGATEFLGTEARMSLVHRRGGSGRCSLIQSYSEQVCLEPGLLSWAEVSPEGGGGFEQGAERRAGV